MIGFMQLLRRGVALCVMLVPALGHAAPNGEELFNQHCASCHGYDGHGGVGVPLSLPSFLNSVPDDYLEKTIRHGRPGRVMPSFKHLSDAQIMAIVGHLRSFAPGKQPPVASSVMIRGDVKHGKQLYESRCAACHGVNGEGGKGTGVTFSRPRDLPIIAPSISNPGFLAAATDSMIKSTLVNGREGTPMQSFIKQGLSEKDIDDIVSYVRSFESREHKPQQLATSTEEATIIADANGTLDQVVEKIKNAAVAENFRIIRVQDLEEGLVEKGKEKHREVMVYFCNFNTLNKVLAVDPRVGLFLPCRITVVEREGKVQIMAINPRYLSALYNNDELDKLCDEMHQIYTNIIEEAAL